MHERRELVTQLRLREHLSLNQIVKRLADMGFVSILSGKPFGKTIISEDLKFIQQQSIDRANATIDEHRAEVLAELDEVSKVAWTKKQKIKLDGEETLIDDPDLMIVLAAAKQRRAVTGVDSPTKISPTDPTGMREYGADARSIILSKLIPELTSESEEGEDS